MSENLLGGQIRRVNRVKLGVGLALGAWLASLFFFQAGWVTRLGRSAPTLSAPTLYQPVLGQAVNIGDVQLAGQASPLSAVEAWVDGALAATTSATAEGEWRMTLELTQPGPHTLRLRALAGEESQESAPYTLFITPPPPSLSVPRSGYELVKGALTLTGIGTPQTSLAVWLDGQPAATAPIGPDGRWTATLHGVKPGLRDLQLRIVAADGQTLATRDVLNVPIEAEYIPPSVDAPAPDALISAPFTVEGRGMPGASVEIVVDNELVGGSQVAADGSWRFSSQTVAAGQHQLAVRGLDRLGHTRATTLPQVFRLEPPFAPLTIHASPSALSVGDSLTLTGSGEPTAALDILVNASAIATTTVDADGQWAYTPLTFTLPGAYRVGVQALTPDARVVASPLLSVTVAPRPIVITPTLTLPQGSATYVTGEHRLQGTGDPALTLVILINATLSVPVAVDDSGMWSKLVTFDPGTYSLVAVAQDDAGAERSRSTALTLTVVSTARPADCINPVIYGIDRGDSYIVAPCENLSVIAQRTGLTPQAILAINPTLNSPNNLLPGQLLNLPPRP